MRNLTRAIIGDGGKYSSLERSLYLLYASEILIILINILLAKKIITINYEKNIHRLNADLTPYRLDGSF